MVSFRTAGGPEPEPALRVTAWSRRETPRGEDFVTPDAVRGHRANSVRENHSSSSDAPWPVALPSLRQTPPGHLLPHPTPVRLRPQLVKQQPVTHDLFVPKVLSGRAADSHVSVCGSGSVEPSEGVSPACPRADAVGC